MALISINIVYKISSHRVSGVTLSKRLGRLLWFAFVYWLFCTAKSKKKNNFFDENFCFFYSASKIHIIPNLLHSFLFIIRDFNIFRIYYYNVYGGTTFVQVVHRTFLYLTN